VLLEVALEGRAVVAEVAAKGSLAGVYARVPLEVFALAEGLEAHRAAVVPGELAPIGRPTHVRRTQLTCAQLVHDHIASLVQPCCPHLGIRHGAS